MKLSRLFLPGILCCTTLSSQAQTIELGDKLASGNASVSSVTKTVWDNSGNVYVVGNFTDSVQLDLNNTVGGYTLMGTGAPGSGNAFVAKYNSSRDIEWAFALKTRINDVVVNVYSSHVIIGGSFQGTVNFNNFGSTTNITSDNSWDGYIGYYDMYTGVYDTCHVFTNTGTECGINGLVFDNNNHLLATGYFNGTLDANPDPGSSSPLTATNIDAFVASFDQWSGYPLVDARQLGGSGDEYGAYVVANPSGVTVTGTFDNTIALDWATPGVTKTTLGGSDVFYVNYDVSLNYLNGFQLGSSNNDNARGLVLHDYFGEVVLLTEFSGTINLNPSGTYNVTSAGAASDVAVSKYTRSGNFKRGARFGNNNDNQGFFAVEAPAFGGARSAEGSTYIGFSFSGTIDINPSAAIENLASTGGDYNTVIIELDSAFTKVSHISNEAQTTTTMSFDSYNVNEIMLGGSFTGSGKDIMPYDVTFPVSTVVSNTGYLMLFNECHLTLDVVMPNSYECGTCTASLLAQVQGAIGGVKYVNWFPSGSSALLATNLCPGTTYSVSLEDVHGCIPDINPPPYLISSHPTGFALDGVVTPLSSTCNNNYGSASVLVNNAIGDYTLSWSNGDTTAVADSLVAGIYNVRITDSTNCYVTETFSVTDSDGPVITVNSTVNASCSGGTGNVDVTVTGGVAPLTFLWSNGSTSEDLTNVPSGTYALIVTDANGCRSQVCVSLTEPEPAKLFVSTMMYSTCGGVADGSIAIDVMGGVAPYTFLWDAAAGAQTTDSAVGLAAGAYTVEVTDANGCVTTEAFGVSDWGGTYLNWMYSNPASCTAGPGSIYNSIGGGTWPYDFLWSNGETTQDAYNIEEGGKYLLTVSDAAGCVSVFEQFVDQLLPNTPDVCMVTVDSTGTKNVIVWDKTTTPEAEYYNIYREGFCSSADFLPIGSVDYADLSIFEDTVVNTDTKSWQYYVTAVDSCGYESLPSEISRTIHLTSIMDGNGDIALDWDAYIGREISGYDIFRVDENDSTVFNLIDSVSAFTLNYLDTDDFSGYTDHDIEYYVEAVTVNPCFASRAFNQNASRSNHTRVAGLAIIIDTTGFGDELSIEELIQVYPNPANDRLNIRVSGHDVSFQAVLTNQVGQTIKQLDINRAVSISTTELQQGVYFLRMTNSDKRSKTYKIIIAH